MDDEKSYPALAVRDKAGLSTKVMVEIDGEVKTRRFNCINHTWTKTLGRQVLWRGRYSVKKQLFIKEAIVATSEELEDETPSADQDS